MNKFLLACFLFFFCFWETSAQENPKSYGSLLFNWFEFSFYENSTFEHRMLLDSFQVDKKEQKFKVTKGKYKILGDTIFILSKTQNTYQHGNISCKYLIVEDSLIIDLDLLWDYRKITNLNELKEKIGGIKSNEEIAKISSSYFSNFQPIKFPYSSFKNQFQKNTVSSILEKTFLIKDISSFFKNDSTILCRFFYNNNIEKINISLANKNIKFIRPIDAKKTSPKRIEFDKFIISENKKNIFICLTLFGERKSKIFKRYKLEYAKVKNTWKMKYIKKLKKSEFYH